MKKNSKINYEVVQNKRKLLTEKVEDINKYFEKCMKPLQDLNSIQIMLKCTYYTLVCQALGL